MIFKTKNNNRYLYSPTVNRIIAVHPVLYYLINLKNRGINIKDRLKKLNGNKIKIKDYGYASINELEYYHQKYLLFRENNYFEKKNVDKLITGRLTPEIIQLYLFGNKHIIFEPTNACNLKCKYCAYGEYYSNYEKSVNRNLSIKKAKRLIDYLVNIWNSNTNRSQNTEIRIGFYGGEPLLNVPFIKAIVQYTKEITLLHNYFTYGMTTNGVLLHKYMDFLVENKFEMVISLDGDEKNNGYRVFPDGESSYETVYKNIKLLRKKFPDYFEKYVRFNTVLHRLNTVDAIYNYFKTNFNTIALFSELDTIGVKVSKKKEFLNTYKGFANSLKVCKKRLEIEKEMIGETPGSLRLVNFLHTYSGGVFRDYDDLISLNKNKTYFPTGTCMPLNKKIFLSASGQLFPCERVRHEHVLGYVTEKKVKIDFKKIADKYNHYFDKLSKQCKTCSNANSCPSCILKMDFSDNNYKCAYFRDENKFKKLFSQMMTYLEKNPGLYAKIMEEVVIE